MATKPGPGALDQLVTDGQLPALPQSALGVLELSRNPDNGPAEYARRIEADPGLASQVLKFVNSSYFGFGSKVSSVKQGITLVGVRTVKNFTLWSAVFSLMPNPKCGLFDLKCLWQDSLRRGLFARALARKLGRKDAEEAFAAALLADMAIPLLAKQWPQAYAELLAERQQGQVRLSDLERQQYGFTHAEAAARFARHWHLPETLVAPIEQHLDAEQLLAGTQPDPIVLAVALASMLPACVDEAWPECAVLERYFGRLPGQVSQALADLLAQTDAEFTDFAPVLQVAQPGKSLSTLYQEATALSV